MRTLLLFILAVILAGCESGASISQLPEGTYRGEFSRSGDLTSLEAPSEVTLIIDGDSYEGTSSVQKFPALCHGTFTVTGQRITFDNECPWTVEFDWTLILDGEYEFKLNGDELEIQRRYGTIVIDEYKLKRDV